MSNQTQEHTKKLQQAGQPPYRKLALAIALAFSSTIPITSQAATFTVINSNDIGTGSLRRAVFDADNSAGADIIEFSIASGSIINLGSEISINESVTIRGPTAGDVNSIIIDGGETVRPFNAGDFASNTGETITLENMTVRNGYFNGTGLVGAKGGGAIFVNNANLVLNHSLISGNSTIGDNSSGGGIAVFLGDTTLNQSIVSGNSTAGIGSNGGGLNVVYGQVTLTQSIVSSNSTTGSSARGAGLYVTNGQVMLTQSVITGNSTTAIFADGAGIFTRYTTNNINQSTISGNSTAGNSADGGGVFFYSSTATLIQTTVSGNSTAGINADGGGIYITNGNITLNQSTTIKNTAANGAGGLSTYMNPIGNNVTLVNSILSDNTGTEGNFEDRSTNSNGLLKATNSLFGDPASEITDPSSSANYYSNSPDLGPLQHNGGLTKTHKPSEYSPAFNTGSNALASANSTDQRGAGFPRIHNGSVDMGAVELQNNTVAGDPPLNIDEVLTRRDMARELLKAKNIAGFTPPPATGQIFDDVKIGDVNAEWIEYLNFQDFTEGCDTNKFCPEMVVTKEQLPLVFLKVKFGSAYVPTHSFNKYNDVGERSFNFDWIIDLRDRNWTEGCNNDNFFCPTQPVTRKWFDFLLSKLP